MGPSGSLCLKSQRFMHLVRLSTQSCRCAQLIAERDIIADAAIASISYTSEVPELRWRMSGAGTVNPTTPLARSLDQTN